MLTIERDFPLKYITVQYCTVCVSKDTIRTVYKSFHYIPSEWLCILITGTVYKIIKEALRPRIYLLMKIARSIEINDAR